MSGIDIYSGTTRAVARRLLGMVLCRRLGKQILRVQVVETEAYLSRGDAACHAATKRTPRNEVMFAAAGTAYVYSIHAKYCFNVVTENEGQGCAVLIRAGQPLAGITTMRRLRDKSRLIDLCSGPAKLCQALAIDKSSNGIALGPERKSKIWFEPPSPQDKVDHIPPFRARRTGRIGVTSAADLPLRYVIAGSPWASGPKSWR